MKMWVNTTKVRIDFAMILFNSSSINTKSLKDDFFPVTILFPTALTFSTFLLLKKLLNQ